MPPTDHFLSRNQQYAIKLETDPGTAVTLTAADVQLRPFQSATGANPDYKRFTNDQVSDDIGQAPDFVGGKLLTIPFGFPLATSGVLGTDPAIGRYLEACACRKVAISRITIGAPTGGSASFKRGNTYTATGGKSGIIEQDISSAGQLQYSPLVGGSLIAADVVSSGGSTATTSGASSSAGIKYAPVSSGIKAATMQRGVKNTNATPAQDYLYRIRGAMGTARIQAEALDAMRILGEMMGPVDATVAGSFFTGVTYETSVAPIFVNSSIQINGQIVCPGSVQFDLGNTVSMDPDPCTPGGPSGYVSARITQREPKFVIDPRKLTPTLLDDLGLLGSGATFPVSWVVGTSPNQIEISALKCQLREHSEGSREDLVTWNGTIYVVRNDVPDEDFGIYFK